jgi:hypothetical protein
VLQQLVKLLVLAARRSYSSQRHVTAAYCSGSSQRLITAARRSGASQQLVAAAHHSSSSQRHVTAAHRRAQRGSSSRLLASAPRHTSPSRQFVSAPQHRSSFLRSWRFHSDFSQCENTKAPEEKVPSLPVLLRKFREKYRAFVELEHELADLDQQIVALGRPAKKRRSSRTAVADGDHYAYLRPLLRVLRDAEQPLPPREVAARLGIKPVVASRYLAKALALGYVERAGNARYRVTDSVRSVPGL